MCLNQVESVLKYSLILGVNRVVKAIYKLIIIKRFENHHFSFE